MWKTRLKLVVNILMGFMVVVGILTFYSTFSLNTDYKFESVVYDIEDGYIKGVSVNTSVELYYKYFDMDNCSIKVVDENNREVSSGYIFNGSKTILYDANGNAIEDYVNIIKGDYSKDGIIDSKDFSLMGKCLVSDCSFDEEMLLSVDVDNDGEFHVNDLLLLDKAVTLGYEGISVDKDNVVLQSGEVGRLVVEVNPSYGVNLNVKWSSDDTSIVRVDDAGRVTGYKEGSTVVRAVTLDGKYSDEVIVKVDNTIQLDSYSGSGYVGGKDVVVGIKSIDYDGISCTVGNKDIASCEIRDKSLILSSKAEGRSEVVVSSSKYGEVRYNLDVRATYLNIIPKYVCSNPGGSMLITVSGFNTGDMSFVADDSEIIAGAYMQTVQLENGNTKKMLRINFGTKEGRTILNVKEGNGNKTNMVIADVTSMKVSDIGKVTKVGEEVSFTISGNNLGMLTCKSNDVASGICRVEGNNIIVTPLATGMVTVDIYNNFSYEDYHEVCGQTQVIVVIEE